MIKVTYDIKVYRNILKDIIRDNDVVVELGCHIGNSTRLISQLAPNGSIIAVDKGPQSEKSLNQLNNEVKPAVDFINADARLHETLEEVAKKVNV